MKDDREIKIFEPHQRRYVPNNLFCSYCGNTHQWQIDLKLNYEIESSSHGLLFNLESNRTIRILKAIETNVYQMLERSYNRDKPIFKCGNCGNTQLDFHEQVLESCWYMDCPGCFHCGNWLEKDFVIELCTDCITEKGGKITDEDCTMFCPHYDDGLGEVRDHYNISLGDLKRQLGYLG